jgi:hypothetical protein
MGIKIDLTGVIFCANMNIDQFRTTERIIMTSISTNELKSSAIPAIIGNTVATMAVSAVIMIFILFSNTVGFTQHVELVITVPFFVLGLALYAKTQIDGVLLMTRLLGQCTTDTQVAAVITGLTVCNGVATIAMDAIYVSVHSLVWLTAGIICMASLYLGELAYEAYKGLSEDQDHDGIADNEESPVSEFLGKTLLSIAITSFSALIVLYGDGTAANLELLTPANLLSFTLAGVVGQYLLGLAASLFPREKISELANNHWFHVLGIIAFVGLGAYGQFESIEMFLHGYGLVSGLSMVAASFGGYFAIKLGISLLPVKVEDADEAVESVSAE